MRTHRSWTPQAAQRRRTLQALLLAGAVGVAGTSLLLSCSAERDYRTLSFFFDGVPDPNAPPVPAPGDARRRHEAARQQRVEGQPELPESSSHEPFVNHLCSECHIIPETTEARPSWIMGKPKLRYPVEELCARCHEPPQATYIHGPVAMRRCDLCHTPHESRYPHLLKLESTNETCISCHSGETFITQDAHEDLGPMECTTCHDPHASNYPHFLKLDEESIEPDEAPASEVEPERES